MFSSSAFPRVHSGCSSCGQSDSLDIQCSQCHRPWLSTPEPFSKGHLDYPPVTDSQKRHLSIQKIARLESELSRQRAVQLQILTSISSLEQSLELERYRISLARVLPTEILEIIFSEFVATEEEEVALVAGNMPALDLSHVCRQWRTVANNLPRIWTTIRIDCLEDRDKDPYLPPRILARRVGLYLSRSAGRPLFISLHGSEATASSYEYDFRQIFQKLMAESHRWKSLKVFPDLTPLMAAMVPFELPQLVQFKVVDEVFTQFDYDFDVKFLSSASALKSLHLGLAERVARWQSVMPPIPFNQLTSFSGSNSIDLLTAHSFISLQHLELQGPDNIHGWLPPGQIKLPSLKSLIVREFECKKRTRYPKLLKAFSCPVLSKIQIVGLTLGPGDRTALASLVSQCRTSLQDLALNSCSLSISELDSVLKSAASVRSLTLNFVTDVDADDDDDEDGGTEAVNASLLEKIRDFDILPSLRTLEIRTRATRTVDFFEQPIMVQMLRARCLYTSDCSDKSPLDKVEMYITEGCHTVIQFAEQLRAEGHKAEKHRDPAFEDPEDCAPSFDFRIFMQRNKEVDSDLLTHQ